MLEAESHPCSLETRLSLSRCGTQDKRPRSAGQRPTAWLAPLTPTLEPQSQGRQLHLPAVSGNRPLSALGLRPAIVPAVCSDCASSAAPPAVVEQPGQCAALGPTTSGDNKSDAEMNGPSTSYALYTVKQLNRIRHDWVTPPASLTFNPGPFTVRRCPTDAFGWALACRRRKLGSALGAEAVPFYSTVGPLHYWVHCSAKKGS
jgi:hypothetical protein